MNLLALVLGFVVSAAFIGFVCTRLICGRFCQIEAEHMLEIESRIDRDLAEHRINGLEPVLVAVIPTLKFDHEVLASLEDPVGCEHDERNCLITWRSSISDNSCLLSLSYQMLCAICLCEYQENEVLRIMPRCDHSFHLSCIDKWLGRHSTCPVCRLPVHEDFVKEEYVPTAALTMPQISSTSGITGHSTQWWLPTIACAEDNTQMNLSSISVDRE